MPESYFIKCYQIKSISLLTGKPTWLNSYKLLWEMSQQTQTYEHYKQQNLEKLSVAKLSLKCRVGH